MENSQKIEPIRLTYRPLSTEETFSTKRYIDSIHSLERFKMTLFLALLLITSFFTYDVYQKDTFTSSLYLLLFVSLCLLVLVILEITKLRKISIHSYTRADYGVVKKKEDKNALTLFFPYPNGFIENVSCSPTLWEAVNVGDIVFVLSFDDKKCIAIEKKKS